MSHCGVDDAEGGRWSSRSWRSRWSLLLMPYVRDFVDLLGSDEDGTDNTVSVLVEWLIGGVLAFLLYSAIVAAPGLLARLRHRA